MLAARRDKLLWCGGRYQLRSDKQVKGVPAMQRNRTMDSAGRPRETSLEGFASTCSILAVGLFELTFVFQNFVIPSSSMASTLLVGDHVPVDRLTLAPPPPWAPFVHYRDVHRGDIVVFYKPAAEPNGNHIFW
jgi:Signal peptidase, peptidase S26